MKTYALERVEGREDYQLCLLCIPLNEQDVLFFFLFPRFKDILIFYAQLSLRSCGRAYIGQAGRCVNDRAREHTLLLRSTVGGQLPLHCVT